jgi:hypothetical protein
VNASDVKTSFEAVAAQWDTMRLTYYNEAVIETIAGRRDRYGYRDGAGEIGVIASVT